MGLKILHTADWHLDSPFAGFSEQQRERLKQEQRKIPGKVSQLVRREQCDMVLLAGDIFDGKASRETVDVLKKALAECGVLVFIAPGNHDFVSHDSPWVAESWPENVHIFTGDMTSVALPVLHCRVWGGAFQSMDCGPLLENFHAEGDEEYQIALVHGDPTQKKSPYNPITAAQVRGSGLAYLALGHIHKAGTFRAGQTLCAWPGCPMGRGWDETGEKGVCIVTLDENASVRAVALDTLRFHELTVDIDRGAESALEAALPPAQTPDFFRVTLTGSGEADIPALKQKFPHIPNLELRDETLPPLDIWGDTDADTLEGVYFRLLKASMEEDPDSREEIQLAAEISRKILAGREVKL